METLTKENFWDEMEQKYPKAMAHFKEWIDRYKSEHDWEDLFNHNTEYQDTLAPKYHELPIAMQFGIFLEWADTHKSAFSFTVVAGDWPEDIKEVIAWILKDVQEGIFP